MEEDKPTVQLTGENGNAFAIMGNCQRAARRAGWSQEKIDEVLKEMQTGNYDHLLQTAMKHFDVK